MAQQPFPIFPLCQFFTFQPPGEHHNGLAGPSQALPCLTKPVDKPARPALARPTLCLWQPIQFFPLSQFFSLLAAWSEDLVIVLGRLRHGPSDLKKIKMYWQFFITSMSSGRISLQNPQNPLRFSLKVNGAAQRHAKNLQNPLRFQ